MKLIKLDDLNIVPLEEIRRKLNRKYCKIVADDEINEIREKFNIDEIESNLPNNVIPKPEECSESSRRNARFIRPKYISAGHTTNFSFGLILRKTTSIEDISVSPN